MSSIKTYHNKAAVVNYHPNENVLHLKLRHPRQKDHFKKLEDQIKTTLNVDATDQDSPTSIMLKLSPDSNAESVHEYLQTILAGGQETFDANDVGDEETNQPEPQQPQPGVVPGGAPPTSPGQLPTESFNFSKLFTMLTESTYRTAEYWDVLQQATGKAKQRIEHTDVLTLRRAYTKKRRSASRDQVLRALDSAAKYFVRRLRKTVGDDSARLFKDKYKKIGGLTPHDYDEAGPNLEPEPQPGLPTAGMPEPPQMDMNFSDFFPLSDDEEKEEETKETPDEKYSGEEEEYPE